MILFLLYIQLVLHNQCLLTLIIDGNNSNTQRFLVDSFHWNVSVSQQYPSSSHFPYSIRLLKILQTCADSNVLLCQPPGSYSGGRWRLLSTVNLTSSKDTGRNIWSWASEVSNAIYKMLSCHSNQETSSQHLADVWKKNSQLKHRLRVALMNPNPLSFPHDFFTRLS